MELTDFPKEGSSYRNVMYCINMDLIKIYNFYLKFFWNDAYLTEYVYKEK